MRKTSRGGSVKLGPGILHAPDEDPEAVAEELRSLGWRVYVLPDDIADVWALRDALSRTFPLNPPLGEGGSGDALSDSLFEGLMDTDGDRIAIVWPRSETMVQGDYAGFRDEREARNAYQTARDVFAQVVFQLWDPLTTGDEPTKMLLVVLT